MNIDREKLEKLFDEHFKDEPSSEVFDAMNEIIDYAEKAVKLFAIPNVVGRSEQFICRDCGKDTIEWADGLCEDCTLQGFK